MGYINAVLLLFLLGLPILIEVQKKKRNPALKKWLVSSRKIHPIIGMVLIVTSALHGYSKLGDFVWHTGSLLWLLLVLNGALGLYMKKAKKRQLWLIHRFTGVVILLAFGLHYFLPWFFI